MAPWFVRSPPVMTIRRTTTISVHLGRTPLDQLQAQVERFLARDGGLVEVAIVGFDYFSQDTLAALTSMVDRGAGRVRLTGLDRFGEALLAEPGDVDLRDLSERAVTTLRTTVVVSAHTAGRELGEAEFARSLRAAAATELPIVTVDFRRFAELAPAVALELAELSAVLHRSGRTLLLVNANVRIGEQVKAAGLSGPVHLAVEQF